MKPWQLTYEHEQAELVGFDYGDGVQRPNYAPRRVITPCNALAPDHVKPCLHTFGGGNSFCQKVYGHPGGHSTKPSACNRPAGHEGPHAFIVLRDARNLGEWG